MDQDKSFMKWWEAKKLSAYAKLIAEAGVERAEVLAREAWYAALNANSDFIDPPQISVESLLHDLSKRNGPAGALGEAGLLFTKKGEDYNTGFTRDDYFPMGLASYAQMLWVKAMRLLSFAKAPRQENYEGPRDTMLDLISYAAFGADWLKRMKEKKE